METRAVKELRRSVRQEIMAMQLVTFHFSEISFGGSFGLHLSASTGLLQAT
jgi:hypothetical protein